jgi:hypothetical protein
LLAFRLLHACFLFASCLLPVFFLFPVCFLFASCIPVPVSCLFAFRLRSVRFSLYFAFRLLTSGYCGSCWAFSATEQIESDSMRTLGTSYILSPEQITQVRSGEEWRCAEDVL